jgi:hypothetical protein
LFLELHLAHQEAANPASQNKQGGIPSVHAAKSSSAMTLDEEAAARLTDKSNEWGVHTIKSKQAISLDATAATFPRITIQNTISRHPDPKP